VPGLVTLSPCLRVIGMDRDFGARMDPEAGPKPDVDAATAHQTEPLSMRKPTVPALVSADR